MRKAYITSIETKSKPLQLGDKYGMLTVIFEASRTGKYNRRFNCVCDCGKEAIVGMAHFRSGHTRSCGCSTYKMVGSSNATHGVTVGGKTTSEYRIWRGIKQRCLNPKTTMFEHYGGRGIYPCKRWIEFENFISDMGPRPAGRYSIERKDNNGHYNKSNCIWATDKEQLRNTSRNVVTHEIAAKIRELFASGLKVREISEIVRLNYTTTYNVVDARPHRRTWVN